MTADGREGQSAQASFDRSDARALLIIAGLALAYRLLYLWTVPRVIDSADAVGYAEAVRMLARGDLSAWQPYTPPLYPLAAVPLYWLTGDVEWSARLVSFAASMMLAALAWLLARELFGRQAAFAAGIVFALWPWLGDYAWRIAPESLAVALWFAGAWAVLRGLKQGGWPCLLAPLCFFCLHFTRPEGTYLMGAAGIAAALSCAGAASGQWKRLAIMIALGAGLLLAQSVISYFLVGSGAVNPRTADPAETVAYILGERLGAVAGNVTHYMTHVIPVMLGPLLMLFGGVGLFMKGGEARDLRGESFLLLLAAAQTALAILSSYQEPRYVMAAVAACALWAARGVVVTADQFHSKSLRTLPLAAAVLFQAILTAFSIAPDVVGATPRMPREYKLAGEWLAEHAEPGLIITRKPQVGFYADMPTTGPGEQESIAALLERARRIDAKYLVVDERYTAQIAKPLAPLLDPAKAPPGLEVLNADVSPYPKARVVIYRILPE